MGSSCSKKTNRIEPVSSSDTDTSSEVSETLSGPMYERELLRRLHNTSINIDYNKSNPFYATISDYYYYDH